MSSINRIFKDTAIYALAPQLPRLLNLFLLPFITPYLTPLDYGIFGLLVAYVGLVDGAKDLGFNLIITNSYFKHPRKYLFVWSRIYSFLFVWSLILLCALIPVVYLVIPSENLSFSGFVTVALAFLFPPVIFSTANSIGISYLQFQQKPMAIAAVSVFTGILSVMLTYFFIVSCGEGYKGFIYSSFIASVISYFYYQYIIWFVLKIRLKLNFSFRWVKKNLKKTWPTIPHFYTNYILTFSDRILLNLNGVSLSQIGLYSFSYNIGNNFSVLGKSVARASTPIYLRAYKLGENFKIQKLTILLQTIFLVSGLLLCLWMKELFQLLAKNPQLTSGFYLAIPIVMANTIYPVFFASISLLRYHEKTKVFWKITSIACVLNISLNILLIPVWGIEAAAFVTFLSYLYMGFSGFFVKEFRKINKDNYHELLWIGIIISTFFFGWFCRDVTVSIKFMISFFTMIPMFFVFKSYRSLPG